MSEEKTIYWALFPRMYKDGAVLSAVPDGGPKAYKYRHGKPLLRNYPALAQAVMLFDSINYPSHSKLYDILPAMDSVLVVNDKVKELFTSLKLDSIEYLPVQLWDHQEVPVSDNYYIVNPLGNIDFIDMARSDYVLNPLVEGQVDDIDELVINYDNIPSHAKLFRASTMMSQLFISDDVRVALEKADIKGFHLMKAEGWDGLDF